MEKNTNYLKGILCLIPVCLLIYTFAYTNENIQIFYCVLEYLGFYDGKKYSTRNMILWFIIVVLILFLIKIAFRYLELKRYRIMESRLLKILPYLILSLTIVCCFFFPRIQRVLLQYKEGLDGVIVRDRGTSTILGYLGMDSGVQIEPILALGFESYGAESEKFYIKFIDIQDESKQYIVRNEEGIPQQHSMGEMSDITNSDKGNYKARHISLLFDIEETFPGYIDSVENRDLLKFKVVIFNETDSKEFYFYYD